MADLDRARTGNSSRTRSRSRPSRPASPQLHRLLSTQFPDDGSVYHHQDDNEVHAQQDTASMRRSGVEDRRSESSDQDSDGSSEADPSEKKDEVISAGSEDRKIEDICSGVATGKDIESQTPQLEKKKSSRSIKDPNLVSWDGPDDPKNPKNWSMKRKWAAVFIVSSFTLLSPVSSSMIAPALSSVREEFHIISNVELYMTLSIFVLAYAIGPLFLGPLSELYGRVIVLQLSNLFYLAWNIGCGFAKSSSQLMAFRFLSGLGGSAPLAIGGGVLGDCFYPEQRGRAISIYSLAPLLGPAIGPIAGGFIAQHTTWRWCFWSTSILTGVVQICGFFFLQETYAPTLLARKRDALKKETGNMALHTEYDNANKTFAKTIRTALQRPLILIATQPIVQVLACYMAFLYGLIYLLISTFPVLWSDRYGQPVGTGSLNFISLGLGCFLGTQICAPLNDAMYRRLKRKNNGVGKPEFRVPMMIPASIMVPIGLFWYGWSAQAKLHWIMPNIGAVIYSAGTIVGFQCIQTYLVDAYTRYAASAVASATVLRSLAGFGFPLFAPAMLNALDFGWTSSTLAFIGIGLGVPAPFLLWKYGATLRSKSQFAAGG